ncbi:HSP20 family protein [Algoriphagus aquaeductus]|uniref:HSP20 family protein n=1 Tax=Algoriphagus aquaeductus TaxID=475299 RepID=A0A326RQ37_9BACT|nr:Hsp20/alpha crystallin family protein [Algoriphagus aquaeductus]PZV83605.1 HSP20 family protein [Algoriphagus aquaeductus]
MSAITKKNRGFWPHMVKDFFGTENPFNWDEKFWFPEKSVELPSTNVIENEKEFKLELSAPGFDKSDFKIDVQDGVLSISAEKKNEIEEEKENYRKKEFSYSSIRRSFALPEEVNEEEINANYDKGILKLSLPKKSGLLSKPKMKIEIK